MKVVFCATDSFCVDICNTEVSILLGNHAISWVIDAGCFRIAWWSPLSRDVWWMDSNQTLKMGPICYPERSATNFPVTWCSIPW